jgi:hypothetical protein
MCASGYVHACVCVLHACRAIVTYTHMHIQDLLVRPYALPEVLESGRVEAVELQVEGCDRGRRLKSLAELA